MGKKFEEGQVVEADLTPMMNVVMTLIPLMLFTADLIVFGTMDSLPPKISQGGSSGGADNEDVNKDPQLAILLMKDGCAIGSKFSVLTSEKDIIKPESNDDKCICSCKELAAKLKGVKDLINNPPAGVDVAPTNTIILNIMDENTRYENIMYAMDTARMADFDDVKLAFGVTKATVTQ